VIQKAYDGYEHMIETLITRLSVGDLGSATSDYRSQLWVEWKWAVDTGNQDESGGNIV